MKNTIDLNNFIQIAIIVEDIEKAAREWAEILGVPVPEIVHQPPKEPSENLLYRGGPASYDLKLACIPSPMGFVIELHECDQNDSTFREYVNKHGYGVHHIGFKVGEQRDAIVEELQERGYEIRMIGKSQYNTWTIMDTENVLGVNLNIKPRHFQPR